MQCFQHFKKCSYIIKRTNFILFPIKSNNAVTNSIVNVDGWFILLTKLNDAIGETLSMIEIFKK